MRYIAYIFGLYVVIMNLTGFILMRTDKKRSKIKAYRIPEKTLFLTAAAGGSAGVILGMNLCRHKTKHWYFVLGMPFILIVQMLILYYVLTHFFGFS